MTYEVFIFALVLWREARGQTKDAIYGVAFSILNRVNHPTWWGTTLVGVITHPLQYTSMTFRGDPNTTKYPINGDKTWQDCVAIAQDVLTTTKPDPTNGAVSYYDKSIDANPPFWAKSAIHTVDIGAFHFFKFD